MRGDYEPFFAFAPRHRYAVQGMRDAEAGPEVNFGTQPDRAHRQGRAAHRVSDHGKRSAKFCFRCRANIRSSCSPTSAQVRQQARSAACAAQRYPLTYQRHQERMAADPGRGWRERLSLPRFPARLREQAVARDRQPQAGAEGDEPRRHQEHAAIRARATTTRSPQRSSACSVSRMLGKSLGPKLERGGLTCCKIRDSRQTPHPASRCRLQRRLPWWRWHSLACRDCLRRRKILRPPGWRYGVDAKS